MKPEQTSTPRRVYTFQRVRIEAWRTLDERCVAQYITICQPARIALKLKAAVDCPLLIIQNYPEVNFTSAELINDHRNLYDFVDPEYCENDCNLFDDQDANYRLPCVSINNGQLVFELHFGDFNTLIKLFPEDTVYPCLKLYFRFA